MEKQIKKYILRLGADLCGIAHIDRFAGAPQGFHPKDVFPGCRFGKNNNRKARRYPHMA